MDTTATGDYNATLSYTEGAWSNTNTVSKQIKISVAEEKTNEQYSYISNGEIAQVNAIYSTEKSVHIPDTIDGAQVINDYGDIYDNPANTIPPSVIPSCPRCYSTICLIRITHYGLSILL